MAATRIVLKEMDPPPSPERAFELLARDERPFFLDTGMRLAELAGLRIADVDFEQNIALVLGKGRRQRACPFGHKTAQALDRISVFGAGTATRPGPSSGSVWPGR